MAGIDPFASITAATLDLLTRDGDLFLTLGTTLFRGFAVILVAWFNLRMWKLRRRTPPLKKHQGRGTLKLTSREITVVV